MSLFRMKDVSSHPLSDSERVYISSICCIKSDEDQLHLFASTGETLIHGYTFTALSKTDYVPTVTFDNRDVVYNLSELCYSDPNTELSKVYLAVLAYKSVSVLKLQNEGSDLIKTFKQDFDCQLLSMTALESTMVVQLLDGAFHIFRNFKHFFTIRMATCLLPSLFCYSVVKDFLYLCGSDRCISAFSLQSLNIAANSSAPHMGRYTKNPKMLHNNPEPRQPKNVVPNSCEMLPDQIFNFVMHESVVANSVQFIGLGRRSIHLIDDNCRSIGSRMLNSTPLFSMIYGQESARSPVTGKLLPKYLVATEEKHLLVFSGLDLIWSVVSELRIVSLAMPGKYFSDQADGLLPVLLEDGELAFVYFGTSPDAHHTIKEEDPKKLHDVNQRSKDLTRQISDYEKRGFIASVNGKASQDRPTLQVEAFPRLVDNQMKMQFSVERAELATNLFLQTQDFFCPSSRKIAVNRDVSKAKKNLRRNLVIKMGINEDCGARPIPFDAKLTAVLGFEQVGSIGQSLSPHSNERYLKVNHELATVLPFTVTVMNEDEARTAKRALEVTLKTSVFVDLHELLRTFHIAPCNAVRFATRDGRTAMLRSIPQSCMYRFESDHIDLLARIRATLVGELSQRGAETCLGGLKTTTGSKMIEFQRQMGHSFETLLAVMEEHLRLITQLRALTNQLEQSAAELLDLERNFIATVKERNPVDLAELDQKLAEHLDRQMQFCDSIMETRQKFVDNSTAILNWIRFIFVHCSEKQLIEPELEELFKNSDLKDVESSWNNQAQWSRLLEEVHVRIVLQLKQTPFALNKNPTVLLGLFRSLCEQQLLEDIDSSGAAQTGIRGGSRGDSTQHYFDTLAELPSEQQISNF